MLDIVNVCRTARSYTLPLVRSLHHNPFLAYVWYHERGIFDTVRFFVSTHISYSIRPAHHICSCQVFCWYLLVATSVERNESGVNNASDT